MECQRGVQGDRKRWSVREGGIHVSCLPILWPCGLKATIQAHSTMQAFNRPCGLKATIHAHSTMQAFHRPCGLKATIQAYSHYNTGIPCGLKSTTQAHS